MFYLQEVIINKIMRQLLCSALFCSVLGLLKKIMRQLDHAYVNAIQVPGTLFWFGIIDLECICALMVIIWLKWGLKL